MTINIADGGDKLKNRKSESYHTLRKLLSFKKLRSITHKITILKPIILNLIVQCNSNISI
jgi:hypothetical protein